MLLFPADIWVVRPCHLLSLPLLVRTAKTTKKFLELCKKHSWLYSYCQMVTVKLQPLHASTCWFLASTLNMFKWQFRLSHILYKKTDHTIKKPFHFGSHWFSPKHTHIQIPIFFWRAEFYPQTPKHRAITVYRAARKYTDHHDKKSPHIKSPNYPIIENKDENGKKMQVS